MAPPIIRTAKASNEAVAIAAVVLAFMAYLESSNPKNIPLYERHGFEVLGTIQVGTSPPIFPMLRTPRR